MTDYADTTALNTYIGATMGATNMGNAPLALTAASRAVEAYTGREYTTESTATGRQFEVMSDKVAFVDDFYTTTGLIVALDEDDDGTAETTLTTADYQLYPLNGRITGIGACSYTQIRLVNRWFYGWGRGDWRDWRPTRPTLHVTAKWGWASVPDVIERATLMLAAEMLKDPETPFGIIGFEGNVSPALIRLRANPRIAQALEPFVRTGPTVH